MESSWIESKRSRLSETPVLRPSKLELPNLNPNPSFTPLPALNLHLIPYSGGLEETAAKPTKISSLSLRAKTHRFA
jgi:hypothetical protein